MPDHDHYHLQHEQPLDIPNFLHLQHEQPLDLDQRFDFIVAEHLHLHVNQHLHPHLDQHYGPAVSHQYDDHAAG